MSNVWKEVDKIKGNTYNTKPQPDPERVASSLPNKKCEESSLDNLPLFISITLLN